MPEGFPVLSVISVMLSVRKAYSCSRERSDTVDAEWGEDDKNDDNESDPKE